jgi:hypothetical protein
MFLDAPLTGHGIGSYGTLFPSYDRLADYYAPVTIVVAPHNFFLEQLAGGGVLLLLAWAVFLGAVVFVALRTLAITRRTGNERNRYLALGIVGGIVGWLGASVFLHLSDFRALLLIAAVAAALDVQSRRELRAMPGEPAATDRAGGRSSVRGLVVVFVVSLIALVTVLATGGERYSNSATLAVVPSSTEIGPAEAYQLDVISRGLIAPTFAEVLDQSISAADLEQQAGKSYESADVSVHVEQSRLGGSITVTVTADDEQAAADLGAAAANIAQSNVSALASGYQLTGTASGPIPIASYRLWAAVPLALIVLLSVAGAARLSRRRAVPIERPFRRSFPLSDV